ncbi:MAG: hypothetical protein LBP80_02005 [Treponema sp.]|jgi:aryl-alcohol dehydrogenase-like predicted oxidoreductase|nr:hypothetical protein [Treponema sp.]
MPYCAEQGIEIISSMTLQQGGLAGIYKTADDVPSHQTHSRITTALIGSRNEKELDENIRAAELKLPADVLEAINRSSIDVLKKLGNNPDYYENSTESRIY